MGKILLILVTLSLMVIPSLSFVECGDRGIYFCDDGFHCCNYPGTQRFSCCPLSSSCCGDGSFCCNNSKNALAFLQDFPRATPANQHN